MDRCGADGGSPEFRVYSVADYLWMIADETRVSAYAGAIRAAVRAGDHVLDVGAGFGFFSVLAAQSGAGRVDAVDTNPAVHLGPRVAEANKCEDRIFFHHLDAARLTLDRPADVIVSDLRGPTPFAGRALQVLIDVRRRLLRPGGVMIPARDTVFVAPARVPAVVGREVHAARGREGVVMTPVERVLDDTPFRCAIQPGDLLAPGEPWARIDYGAINSAHVEGGVEWTFQEAGCVSGLATWFDTELGNGFGFSSAPGAAAQVYRQIYIPFRSSVSVGQGQRLRVHLALRLVLQDYVWVWRVYVSSGDTGREREVLNQNSLAEIVIDPSRLHRAAPDPVPRLGQLGRSLQSILARMDGQRSPSDLALAVQRDSPGLFPDIGSASAFVAEWVARIDELDRGTS
jgi:predicted RNA methylase